MQLAGRWLAPLAGLYGGIIGLRNAYYDHVRGSVHVARAPVISVGNLTVGGTGKTPLVIEIARRLLDWGRRPAILTRGYKGARGQPADEVLEFHEAVPAVPVVVDPDRLRGAEAAVRAHGADCLLLDDGFQHRRLARDLDIVLIDALRPWDGGRLLPAGRLREPRRGLCRADLLVITRVNQVPTARVSEIIAELRALKFAGGIVQAAVQPDGLLRSDGQRFSPDKLRGWRPMTVCGLGQPRSFSQLVADLVGTDCPGLVYPDHYRYGPADVKVIGVAARRAGAEAVVTTRKDWVKLLPLWPAELPLLVRLDVRLVLQKGRESFEERLRKAVEVQR